MKNLRKEVNRVYKDAGLSLSLPSLRIESASADLLEKLGDTRRSGFTFAPEAATEKMRDMINKYVPDDQVIQTAKDVYSRGWRTIKFYFMIGHPEESLEDVQAIVNLCVKTLNEGAKLLGKKATLNVGVSTFIPKHAYALPVGAARQARSGRKETVAVEAAIAPWRHAPALERF